MTEAELQARIVAHCGHLDLWWYHPENTIRDKVKGWVDLIILGRGAALFPRALFAEVKSADGRRSREQVEVGLRIQAAGLDYRLWRPADWQAGTIQKELEGLA